MKESVQVVRFRIMSRTLDRRELSEQSVLLELRGLMQSDIAVFGTLGTQVDFQ